MQAEADIYFLLRNRKAGLNEGEYFFCAETKPLNSLHKLSCQS